MTRKKREHLIKIKEKTFCIPGQKIDNYTTQERQMKRGWKSKTQSGKFIHFVLTKKISKNTIYIKKR